MLSTGSNTRSHALYLNAYETTSPVVMDPDDRIKSTIEGIQLILNLFEFDSKILSDDTTQLPIEAFRNANRPTLDAAVDIYSESRDRKDHFVRQHCFTPIRELFISFRALRFSFPVAKILSFDYGNATSVPNINDQSFGDLCVKLYSEAGVSELTTLNEALKVLVNYRARKKDKEDKEDKKDKKDKKDKEDKIFFNKFKTDINNIFNERHQKFPTTWKFCIDVCKQWCKESLETISKSIEQFESSNQFCDVATLCKLNEILILFALMNTDRTLTTVTSPGIISGVSSKNIQGLEEEVDNSNQTDKNSMQNFSKFMKMLKQKRCQLLKDPNASSDVDTKSLSELVKFLRSFDPYSDHTPDWIKSFVDENIIITDNGKSMKELLDQTFAIFNAKPFSYELASIESNFQPSNDENRKSLRQMITELGTFTIIKKSCPYSMIADVILHVEEGIRDRTQVEFKFCKSDHATIMINYVPQTLNSYAKVFLNSSLHAGLRKAIISTLFNDPTIRISCEGVLLTILNRLTLSETLFDETESQLLTNVRNYFSHLPFSSLLRNDAFDQICMVYRKTASDYRKIQSIDDHTIIIASVSHFLLTFVIDKLEKYESALHSF